MVVGRSGITSVLVARSKAISRTTMSYGDDSRIFETLHMSVRPVRRGGIAASSPEVEVTLIPLCVEAVLADFVPRAINSSQARSLAPRDDSFMMVGHGHQFLALSTVGIDALSYWNITL